MRGFAFTWMFVLLGIMAGNPQAAQGIGILVFPLTFMSSAFVPVETMPDLLQAFAEHNPFTSTVDAMRALWLGTPANTDIWMAFVWCVVLTAIFAPLAVMRYRRVAAR